MQQFTIDSEDDDIRLDRWFKRHHPQVGHAFLQQSLRKGKVKLDGRKAQSSTRIAAGQLLTMSEDVLMQAPGGRQAKPKQAPSLTPAEIKETRNMVIFENGRCIVINKPAGLAAQGGSQIRDSVDQRLDALAKDGKRPKLVHRLDRDTSGVMLLARTAKDATAFTRAFASREVEKTYWALVTGVPEIREGKIDLALGKTTHGKAGYEKMGELEDGKRAITYYRVREALGQSLSWVEMIPLTGRTHQLRAHMHAIGHPIIGDGKYGGSEAFIEEMDLPKQLHLHARRLVMEGEMALDVSAPLPPHMRKSWKKLGLDEHD